jgi:histidine ammonia-lyase
MHRVFINGESLSIEDVVAVARENACVIIPKSVKEKVHKCRLVLEKLVKERRVIYGVTTGFGALGNIGIAPEDFRKLQINLIRSHSTGVGEPLSREVTRALMLLRANTFAKGNSGIKLETLETLVEMINKGVHPVIPQEGSVGASGDLAPLSHMALVMIGEGEAEFNGSVLDGRKALEKAGITPIELDYKEGLALNNGTQMMTAVAALTVFDSQLLIQTAEIAAAMSFEALKGISDALDERIHTVRPQRGQKLSAENLRALLEGSKLVQSSEKAMRENGYPQDPYSLRCAPQVLGAVRDAVAYAKNIVEIEINSATDNPLVFPNDNICLSGGNFHGQPIAAALDFLSIALATLGNISERRIARLTDENLSKGLPAFLIWKNAKKGINSGLMAVQYTAAALASENKVLSHPASVDSIPTSANFEDFVSMGPISARKAQKVLQNSQYIIAIELLCAAQGIDFRGGVENLGRGTKIAYSEIRRVVPTLREDRVLSGDLKRIVELVKNGGIVKEVSKTVKLV